MENAPHNVYPESPCSRQGLPRRPQTPQHATSSTSSCSETTITHPIDPPAYTRAPCSNTSPSPYYDSLPMNSASNPHARYAQPLTFELYSPTSYFTHSRSSTSSDDDNVPLAQLALYPRDDPPAYSSVVRHSYLETLAQHMPRHPVLVDLDEEAAREMLSADEVSFRVERVVAMAAVVGLLVLAGVLVGMLFVRR